MDQTAQKIKGLENDIRSADGASLEKARQIGELLAEQKRRSGDGEWEPWLRKNLGWKKTQAVLYIRISRYWEEVKDCGSIRKADARIKAMRKGLKGEKTPQSTARRTSESGASKSAATPAVADQGKPKPTPTFLRLKRLVDEGIYNVHNHTDCRAFQDQVRAALQALIKELGY